MKMQLDHQLRQKSHTHAPHCASCARSRMPFAAPQPESDKATAMAVRNLKWLKGQVMAMEAMAKF
jgi:hypothetical protein